MARTLQDITESEVDNLSEAEIDALLAQGQEVDALSEQELDTRIAEAEAKRAEGATIGQKAEAGVFGLAKGASLGLFAPIEAASRAIGAKLGGDERGIADVFKEQLGSAEQFLEEKRGQAPGIFDPAETVGAVLSPVGRGAGKILGKAGGLVKEGIRGAISGVAEAGTAEATGFADVGAGGIAFGAGAGAAGGLLSAAFAPARLKRIAGRSSFKRLGELPVGVQKEISKIPGGAAKIGDALLDSAGNLQPRGKGSFLLFNKTVKVKNAVGRQIGKTADLIDEQLLKAGKNAIDANAIKTSVREVRVIKEMLNSNIEDVRKLGERAVSKLDEAIGTDPFITFKDARKAKGAIDSLIPKKSFDKMTLAEQNLAISRSILNNKIDEALEAGIANVGGEFVELADDFRQQNLQFRRLKAAEDIIRNKSGSGAVGAAITPIDVAFATSTPTGVKFSIVKALTAGLSGPIGNMGRGSQIFMANSIASATERLPGAAQQSLSRAAKKGFKAWLLEDKRLMKVPEYVQSRNAILKEFIDELGGEEQPATLP